MLLRKLRIGQKVYPRRSRLASHAIILDKIFRPSMQKMTYYVEWIPITPGVRLGKSYLLAAEMRECFRIGKRPNWWRRYK